MDKYLPELLVLEFENQLENVLFTSIQSPLSANLIDLIMSITNFSEVTSLFPIIFLISFF